MLFNIVRSPIFLAVLLLQQNDACFIKKIARMIHSVFELGEDINEYKFEGLTIDDETVDIRYWNPKYKNNESHKIRLYHEYELLPHWNLNLPLKVIIHGWLDSTYHEDGVFCIKNAYINVGGYNVITMDWGVIAENKNYIVPVMMSSKISARLARMLDNIVKMGIIKSQDIHLIGHSLGAHIAGMCGSLMETGLIGRITGLDPAGPGFEYAIVSDGILKKSDAQFVDVIHTSGGSAGCFHSIGHVDFFPNGGSPPQPGCFEGIRFEKLFGLFGCSHSRAYKLYAITIFQPMVFVAHKCASWSDYKNNQCTNYTTQMGHGAVFNETGDFYFRTDGQPPYILDLEEEKEDL